MTKEYITKEHLDAFGIQLPKTDETSFLTHLNDTLKERIGNEIAAVLDDEHLKTLVELQAHASETEVDEWLQRNVPEIEQIAEDEIDILLSEVANSSDAITASVN